MQYMIIVTSNEKSKHQDKLIAPRQHHEDDFGYMLRKQKLYNTKIWVYTPCGDGKDELLHSVDDFNKDRKDVRILVCENGQTKHCARLRLLLRLSL